MALYGAHRGWRLRFPSVTGGGYINIGELVMFDKDMNRLGMVGSDFAFIESGHYGGSSYPPANAFDGDNGTLWSGTDAGDPGGAWIGVLYDDPVQLGGVSTANGGANCVVEYSDDGSSWTEALGGYSPNYIEVDGFIETKATVGYPYWRCFVIAIQANSYCSLGEMDFRTSGGSISLSGGAPIATEYYGPFPPSNVFDGNPSTFWLSNAGANPAIGYHFATDVLPTELKLHNRNDGYGPSESWKTFGVQYSNDGITWQLNSLFTDLAWVTDEEKTFDLTLIATLPVLMQIWRLRNTAWSDNGVAISVSKMELHETVGGSDVTGSGIPYARNFNPSYPPQNAFDSDGGSFWLANAPSGIVGYDFGEEQSISEYSVRAREGYGNEAPKTWIFECSDGEGGWINCDAQTGQPTWASGETRTFSFTPPDGGDPDPEPTGGRRRYTFCA